MLAQVLEMTKGILFNAIVIEISPCIIVVVMLIIMALFVHKVSQEAI